MRRHEVFSPEQFVLGPTLKQAELDQEVASRIANEVYDFNNRLKYPNNHTGRGDTVWVHVDATGDSYGAEASSDDLPSGFHLRHPETTTDLALPEDFGRSMLRALDTDERGNRAGIGFTLGAAAVMPGAFYGFMGYAADQSIEHHSPDLLVPGIIGAAYGIVVAGFPEAQNLFRRAITNTNFNGLHLARAGRNIAKLGLPEVITFASV